MTYYYTRDHEWISVNSTTEDTVATVGITDYAQAQLGDVVFVEVPPKGAKLEKGKEAAVVESVKAASDVYSPVSGTVIEGNAALEADPSLVNTAPESDGWFYKLTLATTVDLEGLMSAEAYGEYVKSL
jgi:glycine cleavage system H protein